MSRLLSRLDFVDAGRFPGVEKFTDPTRNCGESHFNLLDMTIVRDGKPVLILEDDVDVETTFCAELDYPDDAECVYLGTSHGDLNYGAMDIGHGWLQVVRMFSTHAILHISREYAEEMVRVGRMWGERGAAFDVGLAYELQPKYRVCAPCEPLFYQSDAMNVRNRWEATTRTPLVMNA